MKRKTLSLDLRERIVAAYDEGKETRAEVARRFRVSEGMVKKLLAQRRKLGDLRPQHHRAGRKRKLLAKHREQLRRLVKRQPDLTLAELRTELALDCSLPAIHYVLVALDLTYKKRRSAPPNRTARTSSGPGATGGGAKAAGSPSGSSFSMNRPPRPT